MSQTNNLSQSDQAFARLPDDHQPLKKRLPSLPNFKVCVIGGANLDIQGLSDTPIVMADSNPGQVTKSFGGVGRNIAENLARLGVQTSFVAAIGDGMFSQELLRYMEELNVDMSRCYCVPGEDLGTYLSILDHNREMALAIVSSKILERLSVDYLKSIEDWLLSHDLLVVDTNPSQEVLEYLSKLPVPKVLDLISTKKAVRVKDIIGRFATIKPNRLEAEALIGKPINSRSELIAAADYFLEQGCKQVFISLGPDGIYYKTAQASGLIPNPPDIEVTDITGAGDSFVAGSVYAIGKELTKAKAELKAQTKANANQDNDARDETYQALLTNAYLGQVENTAKLAMTSSLLNIATLGTVRKDLSARLLEEHYYKWFKDPSRSLLEVAYPAWFK